MRYLADENMHGAVVRALRSQGKDVLWIVEACPGVPDTEVFEIAQRDQRLLISFDKGFGLLAVRRGLRSGTGIVLFRFADLSRDQAIQAILTALADPRDWMGRVTVVSSSGARWHLAPPRPSGDTR